MSQVYRESFGVRDAPTTPTMSVGMLKSHTHNGRSQNSEYRIVGDTQAGLEVLHLDYYSIQTPVRVQILADESWQIKTKQVNINNKK